MANVISKLLQRFTNMLPENATRSSPEDRGLTIKTSPVLWPYEIFVLEWARRDLLRDLDLMVKRDTRLDRANYVFANAATRGGITVTVEHARNSRLQKAAQAVIDQLMKECKVNSNLPGWARAVLRDGDIFLNCIPTMNSDGSSARITRIKNLPAITVERNDDMTDNFPDLKRAFLQIDPISRTEIQAFPLWTINHIRWKYEPGERYGRSQYFSGREAWHKLQMMEQDMVVRRRTRAVQRRVHIVGTKDNPGQDTDIDKYKSINSLDKPQNSKITTDYFINGLGDVKNLEGDAYLNHIEDVNYHLENTMMGTGVPLHILGFGRNVNRDIVEDQKATYKEDVTGLQDLLEHGDPGAFSGLRAIFNMALALANINPEDVTLNIRWAQVDELTFSQLVDNVVKLRAAQPKPMIPQKLGLTMLANRLGLDDDRTIETVMKDIEAEIQSDKDAEAVEAQNVNPVKPTTTNSDRGTITSSGKVATDSKSTNKLKNPLHTEEYENLSERTANEVRKAFKDVFEAIRTDKAVPKTIAHLTNQKITDSEDDEDSKTGQSDHALAPELLQSYILKKFDDAWEENQEELIKKLYAKYIDASELAEGTLDEDVGTSVSFDLVSKEVQEVLRVQAGHRIKGIQETTRKQVVEAVNDAYSNAESVQGYMDRLKEVIEAPEWRIEMIARTEMAFAFNTANLKYQMNAGYTKFRWMSVMDRRTCPKCSSKHDKVFDLTDVSPPPAHPLCRCILIPES